MVKVKFLFVIISFLLVNGTSETLTKIVFVSSGKPIQQQFSFGPVTYVISDAIDLKGEIVFIPEGATLLFKTGSIRNGTLSGSFYVKGVKKNSFRVYVSSDSKILNSFPVYNYLPEINVSVMSACRKSILLMDDIQTERSLTLSCSLDGNGHWIKATDSVASVFYILDSQSGIVINNVKVSRDYSGIINKNYAIYCNNSSNVLLLNSTIEGRIQFVNNTCSSTAGRISRGITIKNCHLTCDLTLCPQGWEYSQDHIAFYSIKDIRIENCVIESINVNRIIKTSQYFKSNSFSEVTCCTDNLLFRDNIVLGRSRFGKQMWDMFCGTTNVVIQDNTFDLDGFTRFIEDKADQEKYEGSALVSSTIKIMNNHIVTSKSDLFQLRANSLCDSFVISGNTFVMKGENKNMFSENERNCGGYLQGYKRATIVGNNFKWLDEAVGLVLFKVNFNCGYTIIEGNTITDAYCIYVSSTKNPRTDKETNMSGQSFRYLNNKKSYTAAYTKTREELYLSDMVTDSLEIRISDNVLDNSYEVIFSKKSIVNSIKYQSRAIGSNSFLCLTDSFHWLSFEDE